MTRPFIFLSYCHLDRERAAELRSDLIEAGIDVWWDDDILPGSDWKYAIRQAMRECSSVVVCFSHECLERRSAGIYPEILDAIGILRELRPGRVFLIPVRFSECILPPFELDAIRTLDRLQYVDLFPADARRTNLRRLVQAIREADRISRASATERAPTDARAVEPLAERFVASTAVSEILQQHASTAPVLEKSLKRWSEVLQAVQNLQRQLLDVRITESYLQWLLDGDEERLRQQLSIEMRRQTSLMAEIEERAVETEKQKASVEDALKREVSNRTVVSIEVSGYDRIVRNLKKKDGASAVSAFTERIRRCMEDALDDIAQPSRGIFLEATDRGALLAFEEALQTHLFARSVQQHAPALNEGSGGGGAQRKFRAGAATGPVSAVPSGSGVKFTGVAIGRAERLRSVAKACEIAMDLDTYDLLPHGCRETYGCEEVVGGNRGQPVRFVRGVLS